LKQHLQIWKLQNVNCWHMMDNSLIWNNKFEVYAELYIENTDEVRK
jgi:hypothetical protein